MPETRLTLPGTLIVLALATGFTAAIGYYSSLLTPLAYVAGSSALLAAAVEVYGSEWRPSARIPMGSLTALASGGLLIYGLKVGLKEILMLLEGSTGLFDVIFQLTGYTGILLSVIPVSFGLIYSLLESTDKSKMNRATTSLFYSALILAPLTAAAAVYLKVSQGKLLKWLNKATETVTSAVMSDSMIGTAILLAVSYITIRLAWKSLPISNLIPEKQVESYRKLSGAETKIFLPLVLLLSVAMVVIEAIGLPETTPEVVKSLIPVLSSGGIKTTLSSLLGVSVSVLIFSKAVLKVVRGRGNLSKRLTPYIVFSTIVAGSTRFIYSNYYDMIFQKLLELPFGVAVFGGIKAQAYTGAAPQIIAAAALLLLPATLFTFGIAFLAAARFIPRGEAGNALLSSGIFATGLVASLVGMHAIFLFASVGLSIAVWNIGRTSTGVVEEIGRSSTTPGPEVVRALTTLAVTTVSIGTGYYLATSFTLPGVAGQRFAASILAMLGVLLAVTVIRSIESGEEQGEYTIDPRGEDEEPGNGDIDSLVESHLEEVDQMIQEGEIQEKSEIEREDEEDDTVFDSAAGFFGPN